MVAEQPEIARACDRLARRLRLGIGGIIGVGVCIRAGADAALRALSGRGRTTRTSTVRRDLTKLGA
jgi:hypothetical protein